MAGKTPDRPFCRVVQRHDPWTWPQTLNERALEFMGNYDDISVAHMDQCPPALVIAAFYGPRSELGPLTPYYYRFVDSEIIAAGGELASTDAEPPWPPEYNAAHHDVTKGHREVSVQMAEYHSMDNERLVALPRLRFLEGVVALLARPDAHEQGKFCRGGWKRLRRLIQEEPELWASLAQNGPHLLDDEQSRKNVRELFRKQRDAWERVADLIPRLRRERIFSTG